jgi:protein dithiol:quinone oxidoreductase
MEPILNPLIHFTQSRPAWLLLTLSAASLELMALYFQYQMKLEPCVLCIYIRLAVFGLLLAGLTGLVAPKSRPMRALGIGLWAASAAWGLKLSFELVEIQSNSSPFATCAFLPEFPAWMPLHDWIPAILMPTGMCTDTPWEFMGVTMAQWMIVTFGGYLLALVVCLLPALSKTRT